MEDSFRERVYAVVRTIPKGSCLTYGDVARRAGSPRAARAVGTVLARNTDPTVPCHRVIQSDGTVGGYRGSRAGGWMKAELLRAEGCRFERNRVSLPY